MDRRQFIAAGAALALSVSAGGAFSAPAIKKKRFNAQAVLALDATGAVIVEEGGRMPRTIASVTKLMTALVVIKSGLPGDELLKVSKEDVDLLRYSTSHLPVGVRLTRSQALLLALMASENRAASALGRHYPGGSRAFVGDMNKLAEDLGMEDTWFADPTGLHSGNVSTVYDLARLISAASKEQLVRDCTNAKDATLKHKGEAIHFHNTNALVYSNWTIDAAKTGFVNEAGYCLAMQTRIESAPGIIVVLGADTKEGRVADAVRLRNTLKAVSAYRIQPPSIN